MQTMSTSHATPDSKQSKWTLKPILGRGKPDLAINTTFTRHKGGAPRQIFPYESRTQELSFVSLADAKAAKREKKSGVKQQSRDVLQLRPSAQRTVTIQNSNTEEHDQAAQTSLRSPAPALHRRIRGLRPSPLNLAHDVSPSDRAIPIGLVVPVASGRKGSAGSEAPLLARKNSAQSAEDAQTPTIVITPAKEDFDVVHSTGNFKHASDFRPTSSIYSRWTDCAPDFANTPPVPPLPLCVDWPGTRGSAFTTFEEHDEQSDSTAPRQRLTSQSHLPTPQRSKGWWNFVTSPFSAGSKSSAFFSRSPSLSEVDEDRARILDDASSMGEYDVHVGIVFTNRALDDDELRTALPPETGASRPPVPKRADTAPCALASGPTTVNIYRIPSHGNAAAYYDVNRRFPSMIIGTEQPRDLEDLQGWSPSQSVAHPEDDRDLDATPKQSRRGLAADYYDPSNDFSTPTSLQGGPQLDDEKDLAGWSPSQSVARADPDVDTPRETEPDGARYHSSFPASSDSHDASLEVVATQGIDDEGPFADAPQSTESTDADVVKDDSCLKSQVNPAPTPTNGVNVFSTPLEEELEFTSPPKLTHSRNNTERTVDSCFSPLSASPIVEDAHMATFVGPHSSNGELRQVDLTPYRLSTPPHRGLGAATMASRDLTRDEVTENALCRPAIHERTTSSESFGLGIQDAGDEKTRAAEVVPVWQERGFVKTDGRKVARELEAQKPCAPWYNRFRWVIIFSGACLLTLSILLLVMFVPVKANEGTPVEAEWLNLTGFPPMPTGVSTITKPSKVHEVDGCVAKSQLWSCDAPVADDESGYRFEIRFRNHTVPKNETQLARRGTYTAHPSAPSDDDQMFIGQYADNVTSPYDGEQTPFYISLLTSSALTSASNLASSLEKRENPYPYPTSGNSSSASNLSKPSVEGPQSIPNPHLDANGEPSAAELYPLAIAQPLKLYNRGRDDEHYGFYTYFDRSIYVSNTSSNTSGDSWLGSSISANVALHDATAVCTWSQSRLHVQIWTKKSAVASLGQVVPLEGLPAVNSTANNMTAPGSFPYSVTIDLDRHGGNAMKKGVYCYRLTDDLKVDKSLKTWIDEDRAFGGTLVNPASVPSSNGTKMAKRQKSDDSYGGVDGGTGGCKCQWQNWQ